MQFIDFYFLGLLLWLNKGFSSRDNNIEEWMIHVPDGCYTLAAKKGFIKEMMDQQTEVFAKVELEELGPEIDSSGFDKDGNDHYQPNKYYNVHLAETKKDV